MQPLWERCENIFLDDRGTKQPGPAPCCRRSRASLTVVIPGGDIVSDSVLLGSPSSVLRPSTDGLTPVGRESGSEHVIRTNPPNGSFQEGRNAEGRRDGRAKVEAGKPI